MESRLLSATREAGKANDSGNGLPFCGLNFVSQVQESSG